MRMSFRVSFLLVLVTVGVGDLRADDGAASIAAGGIVVMKREPRIVMAKEVLQISTNKVIVDYDFRNDSDEDVTTEVAFPIPDYSLAMEDNTPSAMGFEDFRLWVDGSAVRYKVEARAFLKDAEFTRMLNSMHVDIASFGHAASNDDSSDIHSLTIDQRRQLEKAGLIDVGFEGPNWRVQKKYYWQQTFPAHKTVHIRHEYTPVLGATNSVMYGLGSKPDPNMAKEIESLCVDEKLHTTLQKIVDGKDKDAPYDYVDFILTTANTWKTPIEDFTLVVERPHWKDWKDHTDQQVYVSFCWDGQITKADADHFSAHVTDFVPKKELRVGFFGVETRRF